MTRLDTLKFEKIPKDIKEFFETNLKEKELFKYVFNLISHMNEYIKYRQQISHYEHSLIQINKIINHKIKYNPHSIMTNFRDSLFYYTLEINSYEGRNFGKDNIISTHVREQSSTSNTNRINVYRDGDIFNYISFKNYNVGDSFKIHIGDFTLFEITLMKDNWYKRFIPIKNKYPIDFNVFRWYEISVTRLNGLIDKEIYIYITTITDNLKKNLQEESILNNGIYNNIGINFNPDNSIRN